MKKLLLLTLGVASLQAGILDVSPTVIFKTTKTYKESGVGFELVNKSKRPIWIVLINGENTTLVTKVGPTTKIKRLRVSFDHIDITKPTIMAVWYSDPGEVSFKKKYTIGGARLFKPAPNKVYTFTTGKTLYLTWDKANYARPQTGLLYGKLGKTDSNLSLADNVSKTDIKEQAPASS